MKKSMRAILPMMPVLGLMVMVSGCAGTLGNKGLMLEQMQTRYEELGQLVAQAQHCNVPVEQSQLDATLQQYAAKNGAAADEQRSLVSYFDAAIQNQSRTAGQTPCSDDDKTRLSALLNDKLNQFK